jgi:hypothetical protein
LDRLIERRSRQKDPDEESELWKASVRAYEKKHRQVARLEWHASSGTPRVARLSSQAGRTPPPHARGVNQLPRNASTEPTDGRRSMSATDKMSETYEQLRDSRREKCGWRAMGSPTTAKGARDE